MNLSLGVVVPCYNEEEVLCETSKRLVSIVDRMIEEHLKSIMSCRADYLYIKSLSLLDKYDLSLEQLNCIGYVVCCENRNGLLLRKKQHS